MSQDQLDLFSDCRDVMLRNDVCEALLRRDPDASRTNLLDLENEYPNDPSREAFEMLVGVLEQGPPASPAQPEAARAASLWLEQQVGPAAHRALGDEAGARWIEPCWQALAEAAEPLAFDPACCEGHAAPLWLRARQWQRAAHAAAAIPSWRRIPAPLGWVAQARHRMLGLDAAWPLLAELAWIAPRRFEEVAVRLDDPVLLRLRKRFDAAHEGAGGPHDLVWFPAWALIDEPRLERPLGEAQVQRACHPERALRVVSELLSLERQGRQRDLVAARKQLRDLNESLFQAYMATR